MTLLLLFVGILIVLIVMGMPIFVAIGITSFFGMLLHYGPSQVPYTIISQKFLYGVNSFPLMAVPLFILAGKIMNAGAITTRIFDFVRCLVGHWRGGLAQANVLGSVFFAGMSGSALADAMGLGQIEIQAMRESGYDEEFSAGITAASSTIGPIIPPSIPLIIYGVVANTSITAILIAGLLPGLLMAAFLMVACNVMSRRRGYQKGERPTLNTLIPVTRRAVLPLFTPIIILSGMIFGMFTPTEAAAVAVAYSLILAMFVYRELSFRGLRDLVVETVLDSASVLIIIAASALFGWILVFSKVPQELVALFSDLGLGQVSTLIVINLLLLVVGLFLEASAAIVIFTPMLLPLAAATGVDPIHFGIIIVFNLMIGLLTPPMGLSLFAIGKVAGLPLNAMTRAVMPFYLPLLLALLLVTFVPPITLLLPALLD